jgi:hypothetical protein
LTRELAGYEAVEVLRAHMRCRSAIRCRGCSTPISRLICRAISSPRSIAPAWRIRSSPRSLARSYTLRRMGGAAPSRPKLRGPEGKYIFKAALEPQRQQGDPLSPQAGFACRWPRGSGVARSGARTLCGSVLSDCRLFDMATVARLLISINLVNATIARRCGRSRCSKHFCARSTAALPPKRVPPPSQAWSRALLAKRPRAQYLWRRRPCSSEDRGPVS